MTRVLLLLLTALGVPVFAGVPVTVAPRSVVAAPESPPENPSAEADWETMSDGALMATRFDTSGEVRDYRLLDSGQGNVVWDQVRKTNGNGSLLLRIPKESAANPGAWFRHLNDAWGLYTGDDGQDGGVANSTDQGFDPPVTFEVYYRVYLPRTWRDNVFDGDGQKVSIISHDGRSNQSFEIVTQNLFYRGYLNGYIYNPPDTTGWAEGSNNGCSASDFRFQPEIDWGSNPLAGTNPDTGAAWSTCEQIYARYGGTYRYGQLGYPDAASSSRLWEMWERLGTPSDPIGPMLWPADDWIAIKYTVDLNSYSAATNRVRAYAARRWHTEWQLLKDYENVELPNDTDPVTGDFDTRYNAIWFTFYDTSRTAQEIDTFGNVGEVIVKSGAGSIPVPQWWPDQDIETETVLFEYAAMLEPGESIKLPSSDFTWSLLNQDNEDILQWGSSGYWAPLQRELGWIGKRQSSGYPFVWLTYDANADDWDNTRALWSSSNSSGHGYDHNTVDPDTGDIYAKVFSSGSAGLAIRKYTRSTGTWSSLPDMASPNISVATISWFPGLGLIYSDRRWVQRFDATANTWSTIHTFEGSHTEDSSTVSEYNGPSNTLIGGAGSEGVGMWKMEADQTVSAIADPPFNLGSGSSAGTLCSDPASERFIGRSKSSGAWTSYRVSTDTWTSLTEATGDGSTPTTGAPNLSVGQGSVICISIQDPRDFRDSVTMWIEVVSDGQAPNVWLYKMPTAANADEFVSIVDDSFDARRLAA